MLDLEWSLYAIVLIVNHQCVLVIACQFWVCKLLYVLNSDLESEIHTQYFLAIQENLKNILERFPEAN